jgi:hypothetical protein
MRYVKPIDAMSKAEFRSRRQGLSPIWENYPDMGSAFRRLLCHRQGFGLCAGLRSPHA